MHLEFIQADKNLNTMRDLLFVQIFLFLSIGVNAQRTEILYYMPDSVEIRIHNYVSKQRKSNDFYCFLEYAGRDTLNLKICMYSKREKKNLESWIFQTNRKVVINKYNYPLILDYDYMFSSLDSMRVGAYGNRNSKLAKILPIFHCYSVKFTKYYILNSENRPIGRANKQEL